MMDFVAAFQHWLTLACFVALAVCLFALAVLCAIPKLTDAIRRFCGMDNFSKVVCGVCIVGVVLYGGSKGVNVRWDDGLRDNGTLITNDTVAVRWTYSGIPGASSVFIDYREAGTTNKWLNLAETLASAMEWTGTLANATNYDYWVYSTYVPPVPVHTNGVWVGQAYETKARVGAKSFLILNGMVQEHGRTIATPAAKRRDATLPYDSEVEYLESTGTQWIEIGMTFDARCVLDMTFQFTRFVNTATCHGQTASTSPTSARFAFGKGQSSWNDWYCGIGDKNYRTGTALDLAVHRFVVDAPGDKFVIDGTTYNVGWTSFELPSNPNSAMLYNRARVDSTNLDTSGVHGKLYCCKIWQGGVLVRDYIPVRVGTTGELYDRVSGTLATRHGDFQYGSDVVPVEWLEGGQLDSGIAFIDTGYAPNSSTKIESTAAILSARGYSGRFGNRSRLTFGVGNGSLYLAQGNHYYLGGYTAGTFYSFVNDIPNRTVSVEGVGSTSTTAVSDWYPQLYPVYLFASNVDPTTGTAVNGKKLDTNSLGRIRMKSCNIWENDIPVRKFRPVRVGTEGAMMDTLTRRIYRNAGTGNFGYGNDK